MVQKKGAVRVLIRDWSPSCKARSCIHRGRPQKSAESISEAASKMNFRKRSQKENKRPKYQCWVLLQLTGKLQLYMNTTAATADAQASTTADMDTRMEEACVHAWEIESWMRRPST